MCEHLSSVLFLSLWSLDTHGVAWLWQRSLFLMHSSGKWWTSNGKGNQLFFFFFFFFFFAPDLPMKNDRKPLRRLDQFLGASRQLDPALVSGSDSEIVGPSRHAPLHSADDFTVRIVDNNDSSQTDGNRQKHRKLDGSNKYGHVTVQSSLTGSLSWAFYC